MTAPRIDVVRKSAKGTIGLIELGIEHIEDLHAIGWYRHASTAERQRVSGGSRDFALDNNGDPRYRAAYEQLATTLLDIHQTTATSVHRSLKLFDNGIIRSRRDQTADATTPEVLHAIAQHEKRLATGEWTSAAAIAQPMPRAANRYLNVTAIQAELEALRSAVRKLGGKPDRSRLTPLELNAWQTAQGTAGKRKKGPNAHPA